MQEDSEAGGRLDDDMVDGDLGDGMGVRAAPGSSRKPSQSSGGPSEGPSVRSETFRRSSSQAAEKAWIPTLKTADTLQRARWKLPRFGSLSDLSKDELKERLQEATEVIDVLCCELEVMHRYLEGKYEALRILQGKAILDKATSHTKSLLQKSEEKNKALEKEVNTLQWELSFHQVQMKKSEQTWEQKYNRILSENKTLADSLEETEAEVQRLQAENSALSRQYFELLSMLKVKEQRVYQGTKPQYSSDRDATVLELAVLGACHCPGVHDVCACSRTAAASRKQLVLLQQELDAQRVRREEALMVADAFRIAFEQQLRKRNEHFLLLAETNILKSQQKADGKSAINSANRSSLLAVSQRLRGLLPSSLEIKMPEDLLDTLYRLLDLLNDKDEALAHQRKVSIMLAHSADELQRQLHLDSRGQIPDPAESRTVKQTPDPAESRAVKETPDPEESRTEKQTPDPEESRTEKQTPDPEESTTEKQTPDPAESTTVKQTPDPAESRTVKQTPDPEESRTEKQTRDPAESRTVKQTPDPAESRTVKQTPDPAESRTVKQTPDPAESRTVKRTPDPAESRAEKQTPDPAESRTVKQTPDPAESRTVKQTPDPAESTTVKQTPDPAESRTEKQTPDPAESRAEKQTPDPAESRTVKQTDRTEPLGPSEPSD